MPEELVWELVKEREKYLVNEILPRQLLPHLNGCLTDIDKQTIEAEETNRGSIMACTVLLDRIKRRGKSAFSHFVVALREAGFSPAAQLLDPKCEVNETFSTHPPEESVLFIRGVAADIRIGVNLSYSSGERFIEGERFIAGSYNKTAGSETMRLRAYFSKFIEKEIKPYISFVKTTQTKASPLTLIFRLSNIDAAEQLWNDFVDGRLKTTIENALTSFNEVKEHFEKDEIRMDVKIDKDNYGKVMETLRGQRTDNIAGTDKILGPKRHPEIQPVFVDGEEKKELVLTPLQQELAVSALRGRNAIICAPTGTGKTFIAMEVMKRHIVSEKMKTIAFIVNTVNLVQQQLDRLEKYLPEGVCISSLYGTNANIPLLQVLKNDNVVVLTAQVLVNALEKGDVTISNFSLLVFDECHHTTGKHAYNEIMRFYLNDKFEAKLANLPQILGLSASLGIGTKNKGCAMKAEEHILEICANLDIDKLEVSENQPHCIDTKVIPIIHKNMDVFSTAVNKVMEEIEKMLSSEDISGRIPLPRGCQQYENWVVTLCKENLGRDMMTCAEHLREYNSALMINEEIRTEDALRYLQENLRSQESTDIELKLKDLQEQTSQDILSKQQRENHTMNAGLEKLEELLSEKFARDTTARSKGIIFVRTRFVARALVDWIKQSSILQDLVNPTRLIGCGQRNGNDGMSKTKQDQVIKRFRDGTCNVIVATAALLEGIDIPDCNFAINYGMPGNEITHVQARGRVRIQGEYEIIVDHDGKTLKERDLSKEKVMRQAIAKIRNLPTAELRKQVNCIQRNTLHERLNILARGRVQQQNPQADGIKLHCNKCGEFACDANEVKVYCNAHHLIPNNREILSRIHDQNIPVQNIRSDLSKVGKIFCRKCNRPWGIMVQNKYGKFPCIKITNFRVKNDNDSEGQVFKSWKNFPYKLQDFDWKLPDMEPQS